jgi:putative transposase
MDDYESLSHTKWECKYRVVFISKCRTKTPLMYAVSQVVGFIKGKTATHLARLKRPRAG